MRIDLVPQGFQLGAVERVFHIRASLPLLRQQKTLLENLLPNQIDLAQFDDLRGKKAHDLERPFQLGFVQAGKLPVLFD